MSELKDANAAVEQTAEAVGKQNDGTDSSQKLITQVNEELKTLSAPEQAYVENTLAARGLLPEVAVETGLVSKDTFISREELQRIGEEEGTGSLKGMAARYLAENYGAIGGNRYDINSEWVEAFDMRLDKGIETDQAIKEYPGLLKLLKDQNPGNAELQARDGLRMEDLDSLLTKPDANLTEEQRNALTFMKNNFDMMKTPRGLGGLFNWTTPRITSDSLDEFLDTGLPLGMRQQTDIARADISEQPEIQRAAETGEQERESAVPVPPGENGDGQQILPGDAEVTPGDAEVTPGVAEVTPGDAEVTPGDTDNQEVRPGGPSSDTSGDSYLGPRDQAPDDFGPDRRVVDESAPKSEVPEGTRFRQFGEGQEAVVENDPNLKSIRMKQSMTVEDFARSQLGAQAPDESVRELTDKIVNANGTLTDGASVIQADSVFRVPRDLQLQPIESTDPNSKTIKLDRSMTVEDFARSQLDQGASDADVQDLAGKIVSANSGLDGPAAVIEAGKEIKVPPDLELKAIEADHKFVTLKEPMTVDAFARSQLPEGASDDDVRALTEKITAGNSDLADGAAVMEAGKEYKVPRDLELRAIEPGHKFMKLKEPMTVDDFARSQLPDGASDDDVRALSQKLIDANDCLTDGSSMIEAGREIKIPRELELKAIDRTYEVKEGDNLWKIARGHLKEQNGGVRPSNQEVLDLVNKIVERNSIPQPDLIYPDQKIRIPGGEPPEEIKPEPEKPAERVPEPTTPEEVHPREVPEEVEPPGAGERTSEARTKLLEAAERSYADNPGKFDAFKEQVERFEERGKRDGLSDQAMDGAYDNVRRLLEFEGETPTTAEQRERLAEQVMTQAANPNLIDQGYHNTCNMNTVEVRTYTRNPDDAARLVADVATTGKYTTTDGIEVTIDTTPHNDSKNERRWDGDRSHASEIFQVTAANVRLEQDNRKTDPPGQLRYEQHERVPGTPGSGEVLMDYSQDPPKKVGTSPDVNVGNVGKLRDVYASITGDRESEIVVGHDKFVSDASDGVKRVESEEAFNAFLSQAKDANKLPLIVAVHTSNEPFWSDSGGGAAGGSGGGHVVMITDYEAGPPSKVTIDNSWGTRNDHDASKAVDVHDLYASMMRPQDALDLMNQDIRDRRSAGTPDHWREFEVLRLERSLSRITDEQYQQKLKDSMTRAREDWGDSADPAVKARALEKLDSLIMSFSGDARNSLREHRESLAF